MASRQHFFHTCLQVNNFWDFYISSHLPMSSFKNPLGAVQTLDFSPATAGLDTRLSTGEIYPYSTSDRRQGFPSSSPICSFLPNVISGLFSLFGLYV